MKPIEIDSIDAQDWTPILSDSTAEGYGMVECLLRDYRQGKNQFNETGECLFALLEAHTVIGVAGLNIEPDSSFSNAGRIRRFYIVPSFRGKGLGKALLAVIESRAREYFGRLTVNVGTSGAYGFYESLGFETLESESITHLKNLVRES